MIINGEKLKTIAVFPSMMTVPDCIVKRGNKIGSGNGEAKFYIAPKDQMYDFYGQPKFKAKCFLLKKDLLSYMEAIKNEYMFPSQEYRDRLELPELWERRIEMINNLDEVVFFTVEDQYQIEGPRGYIKSGDKGYDILREIALPLVSYIYVEKMGLETDPLFYWKLFVDFDAINEKKNGALVFTYGKSSSKLEKKEEVEEEIERKKKETKIAREGQAKYRELLLAQCPFCPITMISDERLLIASHIKPFASSNADEKYDPYNGYMLSPMIDKLFDQGYITFDAKRHIKCSSFISQHNWKLIGLKDGTFFSALPMDDRRIKYLDFHHEQVYKGSFEEDE